MARSGPIWQCATVRRDREGRRWLQFDDPSACARCASGAGCGAALFGRLFSRPVSSLPMPPGSGHAPSARVRVGVPARWLLAAAALAYLAPVCFFLAGAVAAEHYRPGDDVIALGCGLGALSIGIFALGRAARRLLHPRLLIEAPAAALESADASKHLEWERDRGERALQTRDSARIPDSGNPRKIS